MTAQIPSPVDAASAPSIHVWMTLDAAAQTLGTSAGLLNCQLELGELETRVNDQGEQEVLIALPPKSGETRPAERVGVAIVPGEQQAPQPADGLPTLATGLVPILQSMRQAQMQELRSARRTARVAWSLAAMILVGVGVATAFGVRALTAARDQVQHLSHSLDKSQMASTGIELERQALRAQLADAKQAAAHAEGELAVERKVEDTLLKNALAQHASEKLQKSQPASPAIASGAE